MSVLLNTVSRMQVQQGLYKHLLKSYGVDVRRMVLLQLHPDQPGFVEHEVPDLPEVIAAIVEERLAEFR